MLLCQPFSLLAHLLLMITVLGTNEYPLHSPLRSQATPPSQICLIPEPMLLTTVLSHLPNSFPPARNSYGPTCHLLITFLRNPDSQVGTQVVSVHGPP